MTDLGVFYRVVFDSEGEPSLQATSATKNDQGEVLVKLLNGTVHRYSSLERMQKAGWSPRVVMAVSQAIGHERVRLTECERRLRALRNMSVRARAVPA